MIDRPKGGVFGTLGSPCKYPAADIRTPCSVRDYRTDADPSGDHERSRELAVILPACAFLRHLLGRLLHLAVDVGDARDDRVLARARIGPLETE